MIDFWARNEWPYEPRQCASSSSPQEPGAQPLPRYRAYRRAANGSPPQRGRAEAGASRLWCTFELAAGGAAPSASWWTDGPRSDAVQPPAPQFHKAAKSKSAYENVLDLDEEQLRGISLTAAARRRRRAAVQVVHRRRGARGRAPSRHVAHTVALSRPVDLAQLLLLAQLDHVAVAQVRGAARALQPRPRADRRRRRDVSLPAPSSSGCPMTASTRRDAGTGSGRRIRSTPTWPRKQWALPAQSGVDRRRSSSSSSAPHTASPRTGRSSWISRAFGRILTRRRRTASPRSARCSTAASGCSCCATQTTSSGCGAPSSSRRTRSARAWRGSTCCRCTRLLADAALAWIGGQLLPSSWSARVIGRPSSSQPPLRPAPVALPGHLRS